MAARSLSVRLAEDVRARLDAAAAARGVSAAELMRRGAELALAAADGSLMGAYVESREPNGGDSAAVAALASLGLETSSTKRNRFDEGLWATWMVAPAPSASENQS